MIELSAYILLRQLQFIFMYVISSLLNDCELVIETT